MANVSIKFNNKEYLLSCDDGQEESLKKLTKFLDQKYSELKDKLGNIGENKLLLITTIQLIDEYFDLKQKVANQKNKLDEISNKFKEIKSLAIKYKDNKDREIKKLNDELDSFKKTIEENNTLYESMLDQTTQSLEKIIFNSESQSKIKGGGNGKLNFKINTLGNFNMFGDFQVDKGSYFYRSLGIVNREFELIKGSRITWNGDPYLGDLNINAN